MAFTAFVLPIGTAGCGIQSETSASDACGPVSLGSRLMGELGGGPWIDGGVLAVGALVAVVTWVVARRAIAHRTARERV